MEERTVISASRTKDLVRVSPQRLAEALRGRAPVRFGPGGGLHTLSPTDIGALAVWTKDPANMLIHPPLRETLERYSKIQGGVILLNLTVTGLGGSPLEPAIPSDDRVLAAVDSLIDNGIVHPEGIILRYDPLIEVSLPDGTSVGNISMEVFEPIAAACSSRGIVRIKTSLVDVSYKHVLRRMENLGVRFNPPGENSMEGFYSAMEQACGRYGVTLDACCNPPSRISGDTHGCIDGHLINRLLEKGARPWRVTSTLHNDIGRQRPLCRCTYSRDIGYSSGFETCFKNHGACLYCFSQKNAKGAAMEIAQKLISSRAKNHANANRGSTCCGKD